MSPDSQLDPEKAFDLRLVEEFKRAFYGPQGLIFLEVECVRRLQEL
jgi:hypothetical protein